MVQTKSTRLKSKSATTVAAAAASSRGTGAAVGLTKYARIRDELALSIRSGELPAGSRLPAERELSRQYGVNRMTVRQAIGALVRGGLIVRRRPQGNFVRDHQLPAAARPVNLICRGLDSTFAETFIEHAFTAAVARRFSIRVLRVYPGGEHLATEAIAGPDPTVLLGGAIGREDELSRSLRRATGRVVMVGGRLNHLGVRSIIGDDERGLRLAVEHLHDRGHRRIGLIGSLVGSHPLLELQVQYWRQAMFACSAEAAAAADDHVIRLAPVAGGGPMVAAYEAVRAHYGRQRRAAPRGRPTALIGLSEEVTDGASAALHELGLVVPADVSLIAYAGTHRSRLRVPALTSVDVDIDAHLNAVFAHLECIVGGEAEVPPGGAAPLTVIPPSLVERKSVARPAGRDASTEES